MTEQKKQTPMQTVKAQVADAFRVEDKGRHRIYAAPGQPIGDSSPTAAGAWKNAADELAHLNAKQEQARQFNEQASKPTPPAPKDDKPNPKITQISRKQKEKRRKLRKIANASRAKNRRAS